MEYFQISSDQALIQAWPPLTSVYLALHGNEVLYVTKELFNLDQKMRQNIGCHFLRLPGCVALPQNGLWKSGAGEAAADGAKDLTVSTDMSFLQTIPLG